MLPVFLLSDAGARIQAITFSGLFQQISTLCSLFVSNKQLPRERTVTATVMMNNTHKQHHRKRDMRDAGHCATSFANNKKRRRGGMRMA